MTSRVEQIAEQVKSLPLSEREELLAWLADFELGPVDAWDEEMARDSQPGGRMQRVIDRVRRERYVKDNTILVNLQDNNLFKRLSNGHYTLSE